MDLTASPLQPLVIYVVLFFVKDACCQGQVSVAVGHTAVLPCVMDIVISNPQVIWRNPAGDTLTYNEDRITGDTRFSVLHPYVREYNLQITQVRRSDEGQYSCLINMGSGQTKTVMLTVTQAPTITATSGNTVLQVGDNLILSCNASGVPYPEFSWHKYTAAGESEDLGHRGWQYPVRNASITDAGRYECIADNGTPPPAKAEIRVDAWFAPKITLPHGTVTQKLGKDTLIECMIEASPHKNMYWHKDGQQLVANDKYQVFNWDIGGYKRNLAVLVRSLTEEDLGEYTCFAENEFGTAEDSMSIFQWDTGHIKVISEPMDVIIQNGSQGALINCTVEGMTHRDNLIWWRQTKQNGYQKLYAVNPSLISSQEPVYLDSDKYEVRGHYNLYIKDIGEDDSGLYKCEIIGMRNYTAELVVIDEVYCSDNTNNTFLEEGQPATLTCALEYSGSPPSWDVTWEFQGLKLSGINYDREGVLERRLIFPAYGKDAGLYTCEVSNSLPVFQGQCQRRIRVHEQESTPAPICQEYVGMAMGTFALIISIVVACLVIAFSTILCCIVTHYKRQVRIYRHPQSMNRQTNHYEEGNNGTAVAMETTHLTSQNSLQEEHQEEQEV